MAVERIRPVSVDLPPSGTETRSPTPASAAAATAAGVVAHNVREEDPVEAIDDYTGGAGVDISVEAAGAGDVVLTGAFGAKKEIDPDHIVAKELTVVVGVTAANAVQPILDLFRRGDLTVDGIVTHEFDLADYEEAIDTVRERRDGVIKAVLRP